MSKIKTTFSILAALLMILPGIAMAVNTSPGTYDMAATQQIVEIDTEPPREVIGLHAESTSTNSITWTWTNPADPDFANTLINVYRTSDNAVIQEDIVLPGEPDEAIAYTVSNLAAGTGYTIKVQTQDNAPDTAEIPLCTKEVNEGNPWGYCTESATSRGYFLYETAGPQLKFRAHATGLELPVGTEYALIYYKDTDEAHRQPSTLPVNILATAVSELNPSEVSVVNFGDIVDSGPIPAEDDINPRGKIWIVPYSEINEDGTLKWTGYSQGNEMTDYLFESDSDTSLTPPDSMGGITFPIP